jgi:NADPH:quinone reductase-like Zn-dependent oxidoreductase
VLSGVAGEINPQPILGKSITLQGIYVGSKEMFEAMNQAIAHHQLKPTIDRIFDFTEAQEAYQYMKSGSHFGKIVIRV